MKESLETQYDMLSTAFSQECANHEATRKELSEATRKGGMLCVAVGNLMMQRLKLRKALEACLDGPLKVSSHGAVKQGLDALAESIPEDADGP